MGALEGEASTCALYERVLAELPHMTAARSNLIRALMQRRAGRDLERAAALAQEAIVLAPQEAEHQYVLGVVHMQRGDSLEGAAAAFEASHSTA